MKLKRYRKPLLLLVIATVLLAPFILLPSLRQMIKSRGPFKGLLLRYSKWRYHWRSPSDMGNGKNALEVIIEGPMGIAEDKAGNLYISDRDARMVWKIEPSGRATVIAGTGMSTGQEGLKRSRVPALEVDFAAPEGLVVDKDGNILLADSYNHAVLKIDREGYLTHFAGNGQRGFNGDEIPATEAGLSFPHDVRIDSKGNVYIADVHNHRIRKVDQQGMISTVAGTGVRGYSGDGGPALNAQLNTPYGVYLDKDDNLLIADSENHVIRKVGRDGIIRTITGCGERGYDGDGGPALAAKLDTPQSLAIDAQGRMYIGDEHNDAVRVVQVDGTVRTLVGIKEAGYSGDGGPASEAQIADPENLWVLKDGSILISARDNARVRVVSPDGTIKTFAGTGPSSMHGPYTPTRVQSAKHEFIFLSNLPGRRAIITSKSRVLALY